MPNNIISYTQNTASNDGYYHHPPVVYPSSQRTFPEPHVGLLSHPKAEAAASRSCATFRLALLLQDVRHLEVHLEELGRAPVQAHALALVELAFPVVDGYALQGTGLAESSRETRGFC